MKNEMKKKLESRKEIRERKGGSMRHFVAKDEFGNIKSVFLDQKINPEPTQFIIVGAGPINQKHGHEIINSKSYFDLILKMGNKMYAETDEYHAVGVETDPDQFYKYVYKGYDLSKISMIIEIKKKSLPPQTIRRVKK